MTQTFSPSLTIESKWVSLASEHQTDQYIGLSYKSWSSQFFKRAILDSILMLRKLRFTLHFYHIAYIIPVLPAELRLLIWNWCSNGNSLSLSKDKVSQPSRFNQLRLPLLSTGPKRKRAPIVFEWSVIRSKISFKDHFSFRFKSISYHLGLNQLVFMSRFHCMKH